MASKTVSNKT